MIHEEEPSLSLDEVNVNIEYLADHADAIPTLAQWHHEEWQVVTPHLTIGDRIAGFRSRIGRMQVDTVASNCASGARVSRSRDWIGAIRARRREKLARLAFPSSIS
jgi:hypothetical protein